MRDTFTSAFTEMGSSFRAVGLGAIGTSGLVMIAMVLFIPLVLYILFRSGGGGGGGGGGGPPMQGIPLDPTTGLPISTPVQGIPLYANQPTNATPLDNIMSPGRSH
jgi:hypothetical protein